MLIPALYEMRKHLKVINVQALSSSDQHVVSTYRIQPVDTTPSHAHNQRLKPWSPLNHLLTHVILVRVACGPTYRIQHSTLYAGAADAPRTTWPLLAMSKMVLRMPCIGIGVSHMDVPLPQRQWSILFECMHDFFAQHQNFIEEERVLTHVSCQYTVHLYW